MEPKEFRALSILILVVGWEHCVNAEAARKLVNVLKRYVVSTNCTALSGSAGTRCFRQPLMPNAPSTFSIVNVVIFAAYSSQCTPSTWKSADSACTIIYEWGNYNWCVPLVTAIKIIADQYLETFNIQSLGSIGKWSSQVAHGNLKDHFHDPFPRSISQWEPHTVGRESVRQCVRAKCNFYSVQERNRCGLNAPGPATTQTCRLEAQQ